MYRIQQVSVSGIMLVTSINVAPGSRCDRVDTTRARVICKNPDICS